MADALAAPPVIPRPATTPALAVPALDPLSRR
jgi:hypothetical protein